MEKTNFSSKVFHIDLYDDSEINNTVCNVQLSQKLAPRGVPLLPYSKKRYILWRSFIFKSLIINIPLKFNFEKIFSKINTVMLQIEMMSEKLLLHFWLDLNLMLNCKHKDLLKFLFIIGTNWGLYWMTYRKTECQNKLVNASWNTKVRN